MADKQRRPLIAGNWKMNKGPRETKAFLKELVPRIKDALRERDVLVAPPFVSLTAAREILAGTNIALAAQNCHWEERGAHTGEVSPAMLKEVGCSHVIIGHSERRHEFGETDQMIAKKLKAAIKGGLRPIFCIGEVLQERKDGRTLQVLERQLAAGTEGMTADEARNLTIAYEPVWAIGTGINATPEQAQEAHDFIRNLIKKIFDKSLARTIKILYGGSVNEDNISSLMQGPDVDGVLVGGASLKIESFSAIVEFK